MWITFGTVAAATGAVMVTCTWAVYAGRSEKENDPILPYILATAVSLLAAVLFGYCAIWASPGPPEAAAIRLEEARGALRENLILAMRKAEN